MGERAGPHERAGRRPRRPWPSIGPPSTTSTPPSSISWLSASAALSRWACSRPDSICRRPTPGASGSGWRVCGPWLRSPAGPDLRREVLHLHRRRGHQHHEEIRDDHEAERASRPSRRNHRRHPVRWFSVTAATRAVEATEGWPGAAGGRWARGGLQSCDGETVVPGMSGVRV